MKRNAIALIFAGSMLIGNGIAQKPSAAQSHTGFVEVDGAKIYFEECGDGPKAVVLMHDGVVNSAVWDDVWPAFCREFHAIRYDRRGYGRSTETTKPYFEADDVAALLRDRKVDKAALVGSSHGGNVALNFALRYPEQVSDLVLVGPGVDDFPYSDAFIEAQLAFQKGKEKDKVEARAGSTYFIVPGHDAAREHLRKLLNESPQDHTHDDMPLPEKPVFPYVKDLHVPTLILIGSGDIADNQAVAGALVMTIPGAQRIVVPDTGHLMYLEKPNVFSALVSDFLTKHRFQ
jgi:pimeloyl-ACP methyl ester carboxylesterase